MELEERVIKAKRELCEVLARMSKMKLAFREERDRTDALSCSSVCSAIKLSEMHLRLTKAWKRESQLVVKAKANIANIMGDH